MVKLPDTTNIQVLICSEPLGELLPQLCGFHSEASESQQLPLKSVLRYLTNRWLPSNLGCWFTAFGHLSSIS